MSEVVNGWRKAGKYHWERGGYTVCVTYGGPNQTRPRYTAWGPKLPPPPELADPNRPGYGARPNMLGCRDTPQEAAALCAAHRNATLAHA